MSEIRGPYVPINQQPASEKSYEGCREHLIGIGSGKNWGTKFSPSWPVDFDGVFSAAVIESPTTVSRHGQLRMDYNNEDDVVVKHCGFWNANLEEFVCRIEDKVKQRKLIMLLQSKTSPGPTATDFDLMILHK
ncbi:hypothetical protein DPSP01_006504 [Paraphaeosphaeria sporulosa]